jgi:glycosyltransferase involved in cell wall biosynthesis
MIVPPADTSALTKAITHLLNNPDERAKYAKAGLERVNSVFSWPKAAEEVVEVYREAIDGYRRSA